MWTKFVEYSPHFIALMTAALMLMELVSHIRVRSPQGTSGLNLSRNLFLVGATFISVFSFFFIIFTAWQPKDEWVRWKANIVSTTSECTDKNRPLITSALDEDTLSFDCLGLALDKYDIPNIDVRIDTKETVSTDANPDLNINEFLLSERAGNALLSSPQTARIIKQKLGIYTNLFMGSGHTLPFKDLNNEGNSFNPGIREYLVKNYCIGDWPSCPEGSDSIRNGWGWQMDPADIETKSTPVTIGQIISGQNPNLNKNTDSLSDWNKYKGYIENYIEHPDPKARILIRFAQFPEGKYVGTFAQPARHVAFFTDARDVWNMNYQDAVLASGRIMDPNPDRNSKIFMWIVILDPSTGVSGLASWDYIIQLIKSASKDANDRAIRL